MLQVAHMVQNRTAQNWTARAQRDIALYDRDHVAKVIEARLSQLATDLAAGHLRPQQRR